MSSTETPATLCAPPPPVAPSAARAGTARRPPRRGFNSLGELCPECGAPISHGLPGNPRARKTAPCRAHLTTTTLPFARDGPRDARRRAARRLTLGPEVA